MIIYSLSAYKLLHQKLNDRRLEHIDGCSTVRLSRMWYETWLSLNCLLHFGGIESHLDVVGFSKSSLTYKIQGEESQRISLHSEENLQS